MLAMGSPVQQWSVNERKIKREGRVRAFFFFFLFFETFKYIV